MKEQKTNDNSKTTTNNKQLEILKNNFANCFDKNGDFIPHKMQEIIAKSGLNLSKESYSLNWLGKSYARLLANETPLTLLKADNKHNEKTDHKNSENLLIKGDNLEVLKHLRYAYSEQVKMIYIDPPYNTGGDGFVYQDDRKFTSEQLQQLAGIDEDEAQRILDFTASNSNSHSAWLTFMYPRLYIARELLSEDGVIFISIDDNEQAQLKMLCDEVFGEENFVYALSIVNNLNGNDNSSGMMETQENCLIFSKKKDMFNMGVLNINNETELEKWQKDELGYWKEGGSLKATGINAPKQARPNLYFPIYINESNLTFSIEENKAHSFELFPTTDNQDMSWYWSKAKFLKDKDEVIIKKTNNGYSLYKKQRPSLGNMPSKRGKTTFYKPVYSTSHGNKSIINMFNKKVFEYPKSKFLIQDFLLLGANKNDLILDFFAGSGTTADAVMQLNAEDGGNRKCISVQLPELIDKKKSQTAYDFVKDELGIENPTIFEITKERIIRAAKKIEQDQKNNKDLFSKNKKLDLGFKIFETLPMFEDYFNEMDEESKQIKMFDGGSLSDDDLSILLSTWMVNDGIKLNCKVEQIILDKYTTYYADKKLYLMDKGFTTNDLKALIEKLDSVEGNNKNFQPNKLVLFGYNFESKHQREISEALNNYINKKQIELDKIIRY